MEKILKYYQWIKGDNIGKVAVLKDEISIDNINYLHFEDDSRLNSNLKDEFLVEINDPSAALNIEIPESNWNSQYQTIQQVSTPVVVEKTNSINEKIKKGIETSGVETNLVLNVTVKIPPQSVINFISEAFDIDAEDEICNLILESAKQSILNQIKETIKSQ